MPANWRWLVDWHLRQEQMLALLLLWSSSSSAPGLCSTVQKIALTRIVLRFRASRVQASGPPANALASGNPLTPALVARVSRFRVVLFYVSRPQLF